ncbi:hypothetical protein OG762_39145 [Streptomyces sp. NBC_01136]|uniref:hypothetical protein n=1 Tax=unclassified Streptomyces TaxID=2593676 RepID=UPI00325374BD|nr:hypothetical protein OG762_39145 [Streptomyces sp. NBC_01136]
MSGVSLRIAVIGLSGSGKSTCAAELAAYAREHGLSCTRVPLARPLYELQRQVYAAAGVPLHEGAQDQVLMENLAGHLRRLNPRTLADDFTARLAATDTDMVLNDDLRDPHVDAPALRAAGFRILRITCDEEIRRKRLAERGDLTRADGSTRGLDLITPDTVIDNSGDAAAYRAAIRAFVRSST